MADKRITDLKNKLTEAERNKKRAEVALEGAERQAEGQQRQLCQTEDQLSTSKEHIAALKKKLEKDEKARDQAEQDGYDVGVAEIEEALRAEVSEVCRNYYLRVWNEAFNQAGVEASSTLLPSVHQSMPAPRLTPLSRWQSLGRTGQIRSLSLLVTLQKRPSSLGLLKKRLTQPREQSLMPPSSQLFLRIPSKRKRYFLGWRLFLPLF